MPRTTWKASFVDGPFDGRKLKFSYLLPQPFDIRLTDEMGNVGIYILTRQRTFRAPTYSFVGYEGNFPVREIDWADRWVVKALATDDYWCYSRM